MTILTPYARYRVDEIGRGLFQIEPIEEIVGRPSVKVICKTGRYAYHWLGGHLQPGHKIIVPGLTVRIGAHFRFSLERDGSVTQDPDPCCGTENPITGIEP